MTLIIIPINFYNIAILVWFGGGARDIRVFLTKIVTNPLIIAAVSARSSISSASACTRR